MGSYYRMPFEGDNVFDGTSSEDMIKATAALETVKSACVVGTGSVGIEIASEIAAKFPDVKLTIVSSSELFLERSVAAAHKYVHHYFTSFPDDNIRLIMGERLQSYENNVVLTDKGSSEVIYSTTTGYYILNSFPFHSKQILFFHVWDFYQEQK